MSLSLVRVDDRLIHGQVVAIWLLDRPSQTIVVVDDATAADAFMADVLGLAAPPGVTVEVHAVESGAPRIAELAADAAASAMVLVKSPLTALRLTEAGAPIEVLNVGGIGAAAGRSSLWRNVSASPEEIEALKALQENGTRVEFQVVPNDAPESLRSVVGG